MLCLVGMIPVGIMPDRSRFCHCMLIKYVNRSVFVESKTLCLVMISY